MTSDAALILRARGGDQLAFEKLVDRFDRFIHWFIDGYFLPGGDPADLRQEGLLGLHKAVRDYKPDRGAWPSFAKGCITRQIITAVKTATRKKHGPMNERISAAQPAPGFREEDGITVADSAAFEDLHAEPLRQIEARDELRAVVSTVAERMTPLEQAAVVGIANGNSYEEIAAAEDISVRSIDNAAQRARRKVALALEAAA